LLAVELAVDRIVSVALLIAQQQVRRSVWAKGEAILYPFWQVWVCDREAREGHRFAKLLLDAAETRLWRVALIRDERAFKERPELREAVGHLLAALVDLAIFRLADFYKSQLPAVELFKQVRV